jgi:hypothetical protein
MPEGRPASDHELLPDMSRRSVLRGAAGAGVAGLAASALVGVAGPALAGTVRPARHQPRSDRAVPSASEDHSARDVVVHLRDARTGEMDVFSGTDQTRLHDKELAARLIRAIN